MFLSAGLAADKRILETAMAMLREVGAGNQSALHPNLRDGCIGSL